MTSKVLLMGGINSLAIQDFNDFSDEYGLLEKTLKDSLPSAYSPSGLSTSQSRTPMCLITKDYRSKQYYRINL